MPLGTEFMTRDEFARKVSAFGYFVLYHTSGVFGPCEGVKPWEATKDNLPPVFTFQVCTEEAFDVTMFARSLGIKLENAGEDLGHRCEHIYRIVTADHLEPEFDPDVDTQLRDDLRWALGELSEVADGATGSADRLALVEEAIKIYCQRADALRDYRAKFGGPVGLL